MSTRSKLLALSNKMTRTAIVEIADPDAESIRVQVRSPSIGQSAVFAEAGRATDAKAQTRVMARIIIECCFDPETNAPIFSDADEAEILNSPSDGWVAPLVTAVTNLMGQAETAAKN